MKISIITPSYNQAPFISRTIDSVVQQTGPLELEYIIVDGQSTDGTVEIIKRFAAADPRVRWVSEPDRGQSEAINKGLRLATGDIVAYLNADDVYAPGALQYVAHWFEQHPDSQWAFGFCTIIDEHDCEIRQSITAYKNFWLSHYSYITLLILNYISQPACFWRRSAIQDIGFFSERQHLVMDYEYWLRLGQRYRPGLLPYRVAHFRSYATNKSSQRYREQFHAEYEIARRFSPRRPIVHALHWMHAQLIILIYSLLRAL